MSERSRLLAALALAGLSACRAEPPGEPTGVSDGPAPPAPRSLETGRSTGAASAAGTAASPRDACCMGRNPCRGRGGCAVPESHDCAGKNACESQGGCNAHCPK